VLRRLHDVSSLIFVPAAVPPHKSEGPFASFEDRVKMLEVACAESGEPRFSVSPIEQRFERSYSILTIEAMLSQGVSPLSFLIGADAFADIETWYRWHDVVRLVEFIVVTRPGAAWKLPEGARVRELTGLWLPISSSDVRRAIAHGDAAVPVPEAVSGWIRARGLYRSQTAQKYSTTTNPAI
jgi:nicotinate-nucleotide adenylyltransferase